MTKFLIFQFTLFAIFFGLFISNSKAIEDCGRIYKMMPGESCCNFIESYQNIPFCFGSETTALSNGFCPSLDIPQQRSDLKLYTCQSQWKHGLDKVAFVKNQNTIPNDHLEIILSKVAKTGNRPFDLDSLYRDHEQIYRDVFSGGTVFTKLGLKYHHGLLTGALIEEGSRRVLGYFQLDFGTQQILFNFGDKYGVLSKRLDETHLMLPLQKLREIYSLMGVPEGGSFEFYYEISSSGGQGMNGTSRVQLQEYGTMEVAIDGKVFYRNYNRKDPQDHCGLGLFWRVFRNIVGELAFFKNESSHLN